MKKTLIAIAAIAAMGAASAEVTLYGKLDAGVSSSTKDGETNQGAVFGASNYETSRIGVKGSSVIADGIKGMFQLEGKLGATDGSFSNFGRQAYLGLSGNFGTVAVGRMWTPYDSAFNDALEYNGFSAMGKAFYKGAHGDNGMDGSGASKNGIQYTSPSFSGFNAVVMYANNADATSSMSATNYMSLGLNYANGPFSVNLATEKVLTSLHNGVASAYIPATGAAAVDAKGLGLASTGGSYTNAWILAGSYDLGVAKVFAAAEGATADGFVAGSAKDTGYSVGVSVPLNKATTVGLGYAQETTTLASLADGKSSSIGIQAVYAWNAATAIYGGYLSADNTALGSSTAVKESKIAAGVRYNF